MPDNLNQKAPEDQKKINISQNWEVEYWSEKLKITEDELKELVKKVGPYVEDIKKYLEI